VANLRGRHEAAGADPVCGAGRDAAARARHDVDEGPAAAGGTRRVLGGDGCGRGDDQTIRLWDIVAAEFTEAIPVRASVRDLAVGSGGTLLATTNDHVQIAGSGEQVRLEGVARDPRCAGRIVACSRRRTTRTSPTHGTPLAARSWLSHSWITGVGPYRASRNRHIH
jgi:hypothetical protein